LKIVAHIEGELREIVEHHGIDAIYTGGGANAIGLAKLSEAVSVACQGASRLKDLRLQRFSAVADYYFGSRSSDALLGGTVKVRGREIQDGTGKALAMMTRNGTLALSLEGARRMETAGNYIIDIGDFVPKGSLLAPGVMDADEQIRPGDEVIIMGGMAFGVGRARMSGWEMIHSSRGVAADIRQMEAFCDPTGS
ncbi:MAG: pseudouridine synthase, partial [Methanotrichaceae archaeon]|nr:pseudouridine synthase [Methanotrichaceae archaeon]